MGKSIIILQKVKLIMLASMVNLLIEHNKIGENEIDYADFTGKLAY